MMEVLGLGRLLNHTGDYIAQRLIITKLKMLLAMRLSGMDIYRIKQHIIILIREKEN